MAKAIIKSTKHIVQHTQFTVASATVTVNIDVNARQLLSVNTPDDVIEGSVVKAVFVEIWLLGAIAANHTSFVICCEKAAGGQPNITFTQMAALGTYPNKKNLLWCSQGLLGDNATNAVPIIRDWVKIPKGKQRFGLNDQFRINIAAIGADDLFGCGLTIYKSYE